MYKQGSQKTLAVNDVPHELLLRALYTRVKYILESCESIISRLTFLILCTRLLKVVGVPRCLNFIVVAVKLDVIQLLGCSRTVSSQSVPGFIVLNRPSVQLR